MCARERGEKNRIRRHQEQIEREVRKRDGEGKKLSCKVEGEKKNERKRVGGEWSEAEIALKTTLSVADHALLFYISLYSGDISSEPMPAIVKVSEHGRKKRKNGGLELSALQLS